MILAELYLMASLPILLTFGTWCSSTHYYSIHWLIIEIIGIALYLLTNFNESFDQGSGHLYVADSLSQFTGVIILISFLVSLLLSIGFTSGAKGPINDFCKIEYPLIMLLAILGIFFIISSNDFLTLYLALELSSLSLYVLSTFLPQNLYSTESGLKYFVLGSLASTIYLLGFSLIYGFSGLSNFNDLGLLIGLVDKNEGAHYGLLIGFALVTFGLLFKLGAVPFHSWLIDVYDGSPTPITTFFALTPKIAIITIIIRLGWSNTNIADGILSGGDAGWSHIFYITAILSLIVGTIGAIGQTKIKRLLAYSAVNHIGFILIAFASGYDTNPSAILAIQAIYFYYIIYLVMTANLFSLVLAIGQNCALPDSISTLSYLYYNNKLLAVSLALTLFSIAGIPPLAGFFSKLNLFLIAIQGKLYPLIVVAIVTSVIATFYYIRLIRLIFFGGPACPPTDPEITFNNPNRQNSIILAITLIAVVIFFLGLQNLLLLPTYNLAISVVHFA